MSIPLDILRKRVSVPAKNIIFNGDFSKGTEGWIPGYGSTIKVQDGIAMTDVGEVSIKSIVTSRLPTIPSGDKVYVSLETKVDSLDNLKLFRVVNGVHFLDGYKTFEPILNFQRISYSDTWTSGENLRIYVDYTTATESKLYAKNIMLINLTETFGAGNEPTAEQMDRLLEQFPNSWFDGTKNLFSGKETVKQLLNLGNKKANKQQEEQITPTLLNGHTNNIYWADFAYFKDSMGFVHYEGCIDSRFADNVDAFAFPVGYRPLGKRVYPTNNNNALAEIRASDGRVLINSKTNTVYSGKFYAGW